MDHQLFLGDRHDDGSSGLRRRNHSRNSRVGTQGISAGASPSSSSRTPHREGMGPQDDSYSELPGNSLSSLPTRSSSWDTNSMSGEGEEGPPGAAKKDRRSFVDVSTPTLVDEFDDEEEEEEMVSLEQERLLRSNHGMLSKDDSHLRRTPGANMYAPNVERSAAALRRTPGASAMHRSAVNPALVAPSASKASSNGSVLGFGLTLTTPVAKDDRSGGNRRSFEEEESSASSTSSVSINFNEHKPSAQAHRPPLPPDVSMQGRDAYPYTPASLCLSKNPNLEFSRGAFSPNTIRLTESIDNLLLDDGDNDASAAASDGPFHAKQVFRGEVKEPRENESPPKVMFSAGQSGKGDANESWTRSYIFNNDGGNAAMTKPKSTRNRRGRYDSKRNKNVSAGQGGLFSQQQPKPPGQPRGTTTTGGFGASGFAQPKSAKDEPNQLFAGEDEDRASPRPLNFGGAFLPPSTDNKNFKRPVASSARGPSYEASVAAASLPRQNMQTRPTSSAGAYAGTQFQQGAGSHTAMHPDHQHSDFDGAPPLAVHAQPFVPHHMSCPPMGPNRSSPHEFHFLPPPQNVEYQSQVFGPPMGMSSNAAMPPHSYHMSHPSAGHPYGQEYLNVQSQQPPPQQFPPQAWGHQLPHMHFDAGAAHRDPGWPGNAAAGWGSASDFGYGMAPPGMVENPHAMSLSPPSPFIPFSEHSVSPSMEQLTGSYSNIHQRMQTPTFPTEQQFMGMGGSQDFLVEPSRPRVRSMDSLSPTSVPILGRGRMQSWDQGSRDSKRGAQQRKVAQRRQRQVDLSTKQKGQARSKKGSVAPDEKNRGSDPGSRKKGGPASPKKKKQTRGQVASPTDNTGGSKQKSPPTFAKKKDGPGGEIGRTSPAIDDPADMKRAELVESPATRSAFKAFYRTFRVKERSSFQDAEEFALQNLRDEILPENVHWRVYLELADLAKRANKFDEARKLYLQVCQLQPYASQGWLEYSKLEEECGHLNRCAKILHNGLEHCEFSESLLTRAIKHEEKMGNLDRARQLLARLKHVGIEKVWKTVLEGALLEARAGNDLMARRVLKYLMHHVPWYGPLYLEAYKLERDLGETGAALAIVERGLKAIPRYGPLWFSAFRLCEALDISDRKYDMPRTLSMLERATESISRELIWKVHLDAAQILERAAIQFVVENPSLSLCDQLSLSRQRFAMTVVTCPPNLCWKVWLAGGRMELAAGNTEHARSLFLRAHEVVPEKGRAAALLECARLEEFVGNKEIARAILCKARCEIGSDWKVWLESVLLEIRSAEHRRAIELAMGALEIHVGTGRLWAALVQLCQVDGEEAQYGALKSALKSVPKSGEVWCEGARIHLNPFSLIFDLEKARRHLFFATKFTPQYGDSFLEALRLYLLEKWVSPVAARLWEELQNSVFTEKAIAELQGGDVAQLISQCVRCAAMSVSRYPDGTTSPKSSTDESGSIGIVIDPGVASSCRDALEATACDILDLSDVELRCANADPNYGLLWFHCRNGPTDTARTVLARAREKIVEDVSRNAHIYVAAFIRRSGVIAALRDEINKQNENAGESVTTGATEASEEWQKSLDSRLLASPSVSSILQNGNTNEQADLVLLEKSMSASDFITGLVELNKYTPLQSLSLHDRRKALFGSDALLS